ncbi:TIGR00159 family protein [Treponema sp. OMZ 840]|uniref:diadenylate cyclase CdaA n=1 Tax=Treponema sp. OMZ 840 TaxID=244313 RepID=UPI003D8A180A
MDSLGIFPEIHDYIRPLLDIGVLAFILYKMYGIIVKTQSLQIIKFSFTILAAYAIAVFFDLSTLLWILNLFAPGVLIGFAIVFQPELRKIVFKLGQTQWFKIRNRTKHTYLDSVLIAAEMLSKQKRGMLAVFTRKTSLKDIMDTGTYLNADLTSSLLVTIFGHDTPLHDGASVIHNGKIIAAGCFLPLSEQYDIRKTFGTRHRAALGLSEETDAVILVVSEETGAVSLAYDSHLHYDLTMEQLTATLEMLLDIAVDMVQEEKV